MAEAVTHREVLQAGAAMRVRSITFLPIERVVVQSAASPAGAWVTACKQPYAVVTRDADGSRAYGIGQAVSLAQLRDHIPNLDDLMTAS